MTMIPLRDRKHKLYSISVRDVGLTYQPYILKIEANNTTIYSSPTNYTMLPKFELDRTNKELATYLVNTTNPCVSVTLLNQNKEQMYQLTTDLSTLTFISKDLLETKDLVYPILLFEFSSGFYSANQLIESPAPKLSKETPITSSQIQTSALNQSQMQFQPESKDTSLAKTHSFTALSNYTVETNTLKPTKTIPLMQPKPALKIEEDVKVINFVEFYMLFQQTLFFRNKNENNPTEENDEALFNQLESRYQIELKKIQKQKLQEQVERLKKKKELYFLTISTLKKAIDEKVRDLNIGTNSYDVNKTNLVNKQQKYDKEVAYTKRYKIINTAFVNKKLLEIAYFFFNRDINGHFYRIPPFYQTKFDNNDIAARSSHYSQYCKLYANMMGSIAFLINYFSKTFNIPLKYPMFVNGSKSFCVKDKTDFIPLYTDPYNEDRHAKFEKALNCLQGNLREIINYLALFPDTFPDLKKETMDKFDRNFFFSFVQFNQLIYKFMEKQRAYEEIFSN